MTEENGQTNATFGNSAVDALVYGFKWFEYHANQRITTFNFYLVVYTGLVAGYGFLLKEKIVAGSLFINLIMVLLSILFWQLDIRNRQLIEIGENIISACWVRAGLSDTLNPIESSRTRQSEGLRFRHLFEIVFLVGGTFGLLALGYTLYLSS